MKVLKSLHHLPLQASPEANNIAIVLRPKATDTRRGGHEDLNCPTWADNSPWVAANSKQVAKIGNSLHRLGSTIPEIGDAKGEVM